MLFRVESRREEFLTHSFPSRQTDVFLRIATKTPLTWWCGNWQPTARSLLSPRPFRWKGPHFSDGNYLYISYQPDQADAFYLNIYSVSSFGGPLAEIRKDAASRVCFLDGGKRIAYLRNTAETGKQTLLSADADGANEHVVLTRGFDEAVALDCNSRLGLIALAIRVLSQKVRMRILVVDTEGKTMADFRNSEGCLILPGYLTVRAFSMPRALLPIRIRFGCSLTPKESR